MDMIVSLSFRLLAAMILGALIGMERELREKDAGFRTHFLVAIGSALFCIVSQYGFQEGLRDSSRVAAQVVSGIGFLGAGTIIFQRNKVRGLTTAAGLWVTAAIGLACGTSMYEVAVMTTLLSLMGLELLVLFVPHTSNELIRVTFTAESQEKLSEITDLIKREKFKIKYCQIKRSITGTDKGEEASFQITIDVKSRESYNAKKRNSSAIERLAALLGGISNIEISNSDLSHS